MKTILIDCTLTGGRGPAKKCAEFIWDCQKKGIPYKLITDRKMAQKLKNFGIVPDTLLDIYISDPPEKIYEAFRLEIGKINFDVLIKFGARTPGPYAARLLGKPYIIIDGGLPDKLESYPSLYDEKTFQGAKQYILTTNFPWIPPQIPGLNNVNVCYFPISEKTRRYIGKLQKQSPAEILRKIKPQLTYIPDKYDLFINLAITDDYVQEQSRRTYGAWLSARQYDQVVGFIRRLATDLSALSPKTKVVLFTDKIISSVIADITSPDSNLTVATWKSEWSYYTEIALDAISNITIARAANYQPYIFALARGNSITTAVPADGYMDEDTAALQAMGQRLTYVIPYDDENYLLKLLEFQKNNELQKQISRNQSKNFADFGAKINTISQILDIAFKIK